MWHALLRRTFANYKWTSFKEVTLLKHEYETAFMRSSGPGGQSVNTTNSKAELRLNLKDCAAVDENILANLRQQYGTHINKEDQLIVRCQESKSQAQNLKECLRKAQKMLYYCSAVREEREPVVYQESQQNREKRLASKKKRSEVKSQRQGKGQLF